MKRGATDLCGILPVDKPAGMTSHDVVAAVRRATGEGRVGHAGTLDPFATGLLVVLVGPASRLAPYLTAQTKEYEALVVFGTETDTLDADGDPVATAAVPSDVTQRHYAERVTAALVGEHDQVPPAFSALRVDGRKAYELARRGAEVTLEARPVTIHHAALLDIESVDGSPAWRLALTVSKGTYVRSLARDLGRDLGTVAHLRELRRTASGALGVMDAHDLPSVSAAGASGDIDALFTPAREALEMAVIDADAAIESHVRDGRPLPLAVGPSVAREGTLAAVTSQRGVIAVYRRRDDAWVPATVLGGRAA